MKDKKQFDEQFHVVKATRDYIEHGVLEGDILIVDSSESETNFVCIHEAPYVASVIARHQVTDMHQVIGGVIEFIRKSEGVQQ